MKPRIALDIDGPLVFDNWRLQGFFVYMKNIGIECNYDVFVMTGKWSKSVPRLDRPEISETFRRYVNCRKLDDRPTPGAVSALASLVGIERIIATARTSSESPNTLEFLKRHYGAFHATHFDLECKIDVARENHVFVDDNVGIANDVALHVDHTTKVILFPTPGRQARLAHRRVIVLEAEKRVHANMTEDEWCHVCTQAWEEIVTIVAPTVASL
jgi:hypothetical protein